MDTVLKQIRWLTTGILSLLPISSLAEPGVDIAFGPAVKQYIDGRIVLQSRQDQFDCSERIYGLFVFSKMNAGEHKITVHWKNPSGDIESTNQRSLNIRSSQQQFYFSSSIQFESNSPLTSLIDPGAGFESYIGIWSVEVNLDGQKISSAQFSVLC